MSTYNCKLLKQNLHVKHDTTKMHFPRSLSWNSYNCKFTHPLTNEIKVLLLPSKKSSDEMNRRLIKRVEGEKDASVGARHHREQPRSAQAGTFSVKEQDREGNGPGENGSSRC